ncbi:aminopeptidase [Pseudoroseomonas deserti]|uniref:Aminopeptidase n=1 Tax=Teichococcus deserti TaxID=1817963 RepID=A0A1V2GZT4_9PROT|nr:M28 family peptidase [Pseudoroseomonas deserti]ONG50990.1 aminopeptidase [Pseudoroseomonas deserti]
MIAAQDLAAGVDSARLMDTLSHLARFVKLAGTPPERESLEGLKFRLASYGYATRMLLHDAYVSLPGACRVTVDGRGLRAITHSMALASPPGGTSGRLVHLGAGGEADFAGRDLAGCILLVEGIASPAVAARAARAGAVAQLHVSPHAHLHEMCISPLWGSPSPETLSQLPRTVAASIDRAEGEALMARLAAGEAPEVVIEAEIDAGWRPTPILVAELDAPTGAEAPFILFSGHHDTWYEGVMDNGAANASMLEAARLVAQHRDGWKRGLRLCFWSGHSQGRYSGSAWYADEHWQELDRRCAVHVNIDSTGGTGATLLSNAPASPELAALAEAALQAEGGQPFGGKRPARNADQSFHGIGLPSLFTTLSEQAPGGVAMRNALGWWWHTPDDLLDKIDETLLVRDTRVYAHALWRLLSDAVLPLDYRGNSSALVAEIEDLAARLGDAVDLSALLAEAQALRDRAAAVAGLPEVDRDAALMRLSRSLVPLEQTTGDRFAHDPALPLGASPALRPLHRLAGAEPRSEAWQQAAVEARRCRNRLAEQLRLLRAAW